MKALFKFGLVITSSLMLGEYLSPYQSTKEAIQFYDIPTAKNFPNDPWNYQLQRQVEEQEGQKVQTLYLINTQTNMMKKIDEEGCTCGVANSLDDFFHDSKTWIQSKIEKLKD